MRVETVLGELPIVVVDDFYADPDAVRDEALKADYDLSIAFYPGRHATVATSAARFVIAHICRILNAIGDVGYEPDTFNTDFSIVTTRPADLLAGQKHPHIDPTPILGLVYLNPADPVGTSFYENTVMNTRRIASTAEAERFGEIMDLERTRREPVGYDVSTSSLWRKYHTIEGRYNRLVIYPGNFFHAIDIREIPEKIEMAHVRLTQRFICTKIEPTAPVTDQMASVA